MQKSITIAEAFNHLTELLTFMQEHKFCKEQIEAVKLSQNALVTIEMLGIISQQNTKMTSNF